MGHYLEENREMLGGPGVEVELDEAHFGKRMHHRGRIVKGNWIFGGVERSDKTKTFFEIVENRNFQTLSTAIIEHVKPESILNTDGWKGYVGIDAYNGY